MGITVSLEWLLGILSMVVGGSYWFTWKAFGRCRDSHAAIWEAFNILKDNDLKHLRDRVTKLEMK